MPQRFAGLRPERLGLRVEGFEGDVVLVDDPAHRADCVPFPGPLGRLGVEGHTLGAILVGMTSALPSKYSAVCRRWPDKEALLLVVLAPSL